MWTTLLKSGTYALAAKEVADVVSRRQDELLAKRMRTRNRSLLVGMTIGTVVGVAAGLLLSPASGRENRKDLSLRISEAMDSWKSKMTFTESDGEASANAEKEEEKASKSKG